MVTNPAHRSTCLPLSGGGPSLPESPAVVASRLLHRNMDKGWLQLVGLGVNIILGSIL